MSKTHYEVLGVLQSANADEIRSAYRKLVLQHHPDRSSDPASKSFFLSVTESYEILSDPEERKRYDLKLSQQSTRPSATRPAAPRAQAEPRPPQATRNSPPNSSARQQTQTTGRGGGDPGKVSRPSPTEPSIAEEIQRLTKLYQSGRQAEAELKARTILKRDARQPMPYAVLGDIARGRGNVNEAAKMYAYAMQMDPRNSLYERRYNEVLTRSQVVSDHKRTRLEPDDKKVLFPMIGGAIVIVTAIYLGLSTEPSIFGWLPPISSWTVSTLVSMFVGGVTVGVSLALGNLVDRYGEVSTTSTGRFSPAVALGCVSGVQFWFAAVLYAAMGLAQKTWNFSTSRLVVGVATATTAMAIAACLNVSVNPVQVFFWGGNIVYCGAICGWIVADAFR